MRQQRLDLFSQSVLLATESMQQLKALPVARADANQVLHGLRLLPPEVARIDHEGPVVDVRFSPDGRYVATGSDDNTSRVWDIQQNQEVARMVHEARVGSVFFNPGGDYLLTRSGNTAEVWLLEPDDLIAEACNRLTRNLTLREWRRYLGDDEPYRKTCPNLPYPEDHSEAESPEDQNTNSPLSTLSHWLIARTHKAL